MLNSAIAHHRRFALQLLVTTALFTASCRQPDAPPLAEASPGASASASAVVVALELKNEPVDDVLQKVAAAAGKSFVIDPDAQVVAHCARISLLTGGSIPVSKALDLVREALDGSALIMSESISGGIVVRRNAEKPLPASCQNVASLPSPEPDSSASAEASAKFAEGVREISETEYELSRASMNSLFEDSSKLARTARVIPQMKDGKMVGMKLFAIRAKSPLASLGLKNGDTVTQVQGQSITSPDEALKVYAELKNAKKVEITLERQGQPMKIVYHLKEK